MSKNYSSNQDSVKLRDSCESCATAKVKCSKDKPSCTRCQKRKIRCGYAESKRHGRPANSTRETQIQASENDTNHERATKSQHAEPTPVAQDVDGVEMHDWLLPEDHWNELDLMTRDDSYSSLEDSSRFLFNQGHVDPVSDLSGIQVQHSNIDLDMPDPAPDLPTKQAHLNDNTLEHGCMSIALELLRQSSIIEMSETCPRRQSASRSTAAMSIEALTATNAVKIDPVSKLLDCSCSLEGNMLHMIWLIISNLITSYARAVSATKRPSPLQSTEDLANPGPMLFSNLMRTTSIGIEDVIRGATCQKGTQPNGAVQTALNELYKIQDTVNRLSQGMHAARRQSECTSSPKNGHRQGPGSLANPQTHMANNAWFVSQTSSEHVEEDLRQRLRAVTLEVVHILVQG